MPTPPNGSQTLYYTNQQSNRLMFYHDHALGITRLNVYAGMAAGYLFTDPVEDDLILGTNTHGGQPAPGPRHALSQTPAGSRRRSLQLRHSFGHPGQDLRAPEHRHPGF